jgi:hypothetical protein
MDPKSIAELLPEDPEEDHEDEGLDEGEKIIYEIQLLWNEIKDLRRTYHNVHELPQYISIVERIKTLERQLAEYD